MRLFTTVRKVWETDPRVDPNPLAYAILTAGAIAYPLWAQVSTGEIGRASCRERV